MREKMNEGLSEWVLIEIVNEWMNEWMKTEGGKEGIDVLIIMAMKMKKTINAWKFQMVTNEMPNNFSTTQTADNKKWLVKN